MENKSMKLIEGATIVGIVQQCDDYDKFKIHLKNRRTKEEKIASIKDSMKEIDIFNPIKVNEKMEIIDGQHRFLARKELGLPINFILTEGEGDKEMETLNQKSTKSNWTHEDYLEKYVKDNKKDYIVFNELISTYKPNFMDLIHVICEFYDREIGEQEMATTFDKGDFKMQSLDYVVDFLEELTIFDKYDFCRHQGFVRAFFKLYMEDFYDKEYIRKRIDIKEFDLAKVKKSTINEFGTYLADELYSDTKRGVIVAYQKDLGLFWSHVGNAGKGKRRNKKKKLIKTIVNK